MSETSNTAKPGVFSGFYLIGLIFDGPRRSLSFAGSFACFILSTFFAGISIYVLIPLVTAVVEGRSIAEALGKTRAGFLLGWFGEMENVHLIGAVCAVVLCAAFLKTLLEYQGYKLTHRMVREATHSIRMRIIDRYLNFSKIHFDQTALGKLLFIMQSVHGVERALLAVNRLICFLLMGAIYFIFLFAVSARLTGIAFLLLPPSLFLVYILGGRVRSAARSARDRIFEMNIKFTDTLVNMPLVRTFHHAGTEKQKFEALSRDLADGFYRTGCSGEKLRFLQEAYANVVFAAMIMLSLMCFFNWENIGLAQILLFLPLLYKFLELLPKCVAKYSEVLAQLPVIEKLWNMIHMEFVDMPDEGTRDCPQGLREIRAKGLYFDYGSRQILKGLDFRACRGELTAVIGESGAGKSTLAQLLARFYDPAEGRVEIDGAALSEYRLASIRRSVCMVPQSVPVLRATFRENLLYGIDGPVSDETMHAVLERTGLSGLAAALPDGLETLMGSGAAALSQGECKRLGIARVLFSAPQVLILDEPTEGLDVVNARRIMELLRDLKKDCCVIVFSHFLPFIEFADCLAMLKNGSVLDTAAPSAITPESPIGKYLLECGAKLPG